MNIRPRIEEQVHYFKTASEGSTHQECPARFTLLVYIKVRILLQLGFNTLHIILEREFIDPVVNCSHGRGPTFKRMRRAPCLNCCCFPATFSWRTRSFSTM